LDFIEFLIYSFLGQLIGISVTASANIDVMRGGILARNKGGGGLALTVSETGWSHGKRFVPLARLPGALGYESRP
jgi:hypothetical protein